VIPPCSGVGFTARHARGELEQTLAANGWPWSRRVSLWIDALVLLEEGGA
jgi:hypothetical protein